MRFRKALIAAAAAGALLIPTSTAFAAPAEESGTTSCDYWKRATVQSRTTIEVDVNISNAHFYKYWGTRDWKTYQTSANTVSADWNVATWSPGWIDHDETFGYCR